MGDQKIQQRLQYIKDTKIHEIHTECLDKYDENMRINNTYVYMIKNLKRTPANDLIIINQHNILQKSQKAYEASAYTLLKAKFSPLSNYLNYYNISVLKIKEIIKIPELCEIIIQYLYS